MPTLSGLAKIGFTDLTLARDALAASAFDPQWFSISASPDRALRWLVRLQEVDPNSIEVALGDARWRDNLLLVLGSSDGLAEFLTRNPAALNSCRDVQSLPSKAAMQKVFSQANDEQELRVAYRELLTQIALFDLAAADVTATVSEIGMQLAVLAGEALERGLELSKQNTASNPQLGSGTSLAVIGMGKTGALELNYISDVDVIFVSESKGVDESAALQLATEWAKGLIRVICEPGIEPPLFEIDANLRPEGAKGALVRSLESHLAYYERWAQNWEFQALLKARPIAGDPELGEAYLRALEPLIWASSAREGFVDSVQRMRERVTENIKPELRDRQIKLGPGGLRDIEFTVQLLQLVHGADDPKLRVRDTLTALDRLSNAGYVGRSDAKIFQSHYRSLRVLEHRVQLAGLKRTHLMPSEPDELRIIARSSKMGDSADELLENWELIKREVRSLHEKLFYRPLLAAVASLEDSALSLSPEQAQARLWASGFKDTAGALRHIGALTKGVSRSAAIQRNLLPVLLHWLSNGANPDSGLASFRAISDSLGDSHWYLRLLRDSAGAAERLSTVLSQSSFVAGLIEKVPDSVAWLDDDDQLQPRALNDLSKEFLAIYGRHESTSDAAKSIRFARRREILRLSLAFVLGIIDILELGGALSDVATATLRAAFDLAKRDIADSEHIEVAIIAMGRYGGRELGLSSDVDVLWVFRDISAGENAHQIASQFPHRISELNEDLRYPFELDAGLRPEGKNGPLIRSLDAYAAYYEKWSDIWETQALVRAEAIAGDPELMNDFDTMAERIRYTAELKEDDLREIRRIKSRVETERLPFGADPKRHAKLGPGSLSDVEWLVQLIQLQNGQRLAALRTPSTVSALQAAVEAQLISENDGADLLAAWQIASSVRTANTLFMGKASDLLPIDRMELEGVARNMGYLPGHGYELENDYLRLTRRARQVFEKLFYPA